MYVAALRVLAAKCEFRDFTDELIRDQLKIQERLLTSRNPTLEETIDIANSIEKSKEQVRIVKIHGEFSNICTTY